MGAVTPETVPEVETTIIADATGTIGSMTVAVGVAHNSGSRVLEVSPSIGASSADGGAATTGNGNSDVIPRSEIAETKPPYVCPGCFIHTYSNNMINRFHAQ
jgi:hypothetical protein